MSKTSPDWKQERDGSVVMDGQVVIDIRDCGPDEAPIETKRANAKLIAAAPDLLAACKAMDDSLCGAPAEIRSYLTTERQQMLAAIAKGGAA